MYGVLVIGAPGAGKSTFCAALGQIFTQLKRPSVVLFSKFYKTPHDFYWTYCFLSNSKIFTRNYISIISHFSASDSRTTMKLIVERFTLALKLSSILSWRLRKIIKLTNWNPYSSLLCQVHYYQLGPCKRSLIVWMRAWYQRVDHCRRCHEQARIGTKRRAKVCLSCFSCEKKCLSESLLNFFAVFCSI